ncbi:MAG: hypothetical protein CME62_00060 [Halobacteriovoraceae bacterium]|nr:hypothetical protein [Halobacteriovoraceae bacterium]|tara:strand:- start:2448 stop:3338 length:891 start_codon:yes stop_codon:yes gene_type:complete
MVTKKIVGTIALAMLLGQGVFAASNEVYDIADMESISIDENELLRMEAESWEAEEKDLSELMGELNLTQNKQAPIAGEAVMGIRSSIMPNNIRPYDPFAKKRYKNIILGKVYKSKNPFNGYDYYRHITVFNARKKKSKFPGLFSHEEPCHTSSFFFADWGISETLTVTLSSEVKAGSEALGLSASVGMSISKGITISTTRRLQGTAGYTSIHTPMLTSTTYRGKTFIVTYNKSTKKMKYLEASMTQRWSNSYPYNFYLDNQDVLFSVDRTNVRKCPGYEEQDSPDDGAGIYKKAGF